MAARTVLLSIKHTELHSFFKKLLKDVNFVIINEEHLGSGFRLVAVNKKRMSQMTSQLLPLIGGFIPRNRVGIELLAMEIGEGLTVELRSTPYIYSLDLEAAVESQDDLDRCRMLVEFFGDKILKSFEGDT